MEKSLTALNEAELLAKAPALLDLKTLHKGFSIKDWETKNIHLHQPPKEVYTKSIDLSYTPPLGSFCESIPNLRAALVTIFVDPAPIPRHPPHLGDVPGGAERGSGSTGRSAAT